MRSYLNIVTAVAVVIAASTVSFAQPGPPEPPKTPERRPDRNPDRRPAGPPQARNDASQGPRLSERQRQAIGQAMRAARHDPQRRRRLIQRVSQSDLPVPAKRMIRERLMHQEIAQLRRRVANLERSGQRGTGMQRPMAGQRGGGRFGPQASPQRGDRSGRGMIHCPHCGRKVQQPQARPRPDGWRGRSPRPHQPQRMQPDRRDGQRMQRPGPPQWVPPRQAEPGRDRPFARPGGPEHRPGRGWFDREPPRGDRPKMDRDRPGRKAPRRGDRDERRPGHPQAEDHPQARHGDRYDHLEKRVERIEDRLRDLIEHLHRERDRDRDRR